NKAAISGTVTDAQGAAVIGADVTINSASTGTTRQVKTNSDGFYEVPLLDIGVYTVTVGKQGFQTVKRENITLQTASETRVDVQLSVGEITTEVTITAEAPLVQTETSERGSVVSGREVTELPLSGRNFTQLATLTPGVARASNTGAGGTGPDARSFNNGDPRAGNGGSGASNAQGSTETSRFSRSGGAGLIVNGQRPTNNNFSLDGVDNNEPQFGTIGVFPNPDSIAEFKITTSIPPAEIGRAAGAVINTTIRSGTNNFHGSLYYYGQNSALNAYHPILKRDLASAISRNDRFLPTKATQQIHEFGGTLGGPIIRNRLFFFFDYLGQRNNLPFPARTAVPTALTRTGNFSEFDDALLNPFTGQPFAGNVIPANLINPIASRFINLYPLPTAPSVRNPNTNNPNYLTNRANKEVINNYGIKLDFKVSDKNSLTGRYNDQKLFTTRANLLPGLPTAGFGAGDERGDTRQISLSDTHLFSPSLVNEFRFGFTQINIAIFNCGVGGACGVSPTFADDIGIPNSNDGSLEASGGTGLGTFGDNRGGIEFTGDGGLFQVKSKNPYFADTLTIIKGNHVIKTGGEVRLRYLNTIDGGRSGFLKGNIGYAADGPSSQPLQTGQVCPVASQTANGTRCFIDANGVPYGGTGNTQANLLLALPAFSVSRGKVFGGPFDLRSQE
ncbi:MAG: carboxypeptidase-like regulatory domain-containing protein, partial [Acidobacteriota bacterium]|nr:carboxypeptidase-like regulatory domain-containing protein [Acidobacteriota bacterium]